MNDYNIEIFFQVYVWQFLTAKLRIILLIYRTFKPLKSSLLIDKYFVLYYVDHLPELFLVLVIVQYSGDLMIL